MQDITLTVKECALNVLIPMNRAANFVIQTTHRTVYYVLLVSI